MFKPSRLQKGELQTITGSEVEAWINERGHVDTLEARKAEKAYAKVIGSGRSITSDLIVSNRTVQLGQRHHHHTGTLGADCR
jgi:hypothetical protein